MQFYFHVSNISIVMLHTHIFPGYSELYDPSNFDEEFAEDYGGFGSGRISGGRPIWEGGAPGRFPPPPPPPPSVPFRRGDMPDQTQVTIPKDLAGAIIGKVSAAVNIEGNIQFDPSVSDNPLYRALKLNIFLSGQIKLFVLS